MLEDDNRSILYQDYTATMLSIIANGVASICGADWKAPSFVEMMYPKMQDTRTADDIKADLLLRLA